MYLRKLLLLVIMLSTVACSSFPETNVNSTKFKLGKNSPEITLDESSPEEFEFYVAQYPEGISKEGDLIYVMDGYEEQIQIVGKVDVNLRRGWMTAPFWMAPKTYVYVNEEDISGLHKYCKNMSFQNLIPFYNFLNHLYPWNTPCYFLKDKGGRDDDDVEYRKQTIENQIKKVASEMGGNAVIGYHTDDQSWAATGFIVIMK